MEATQSRFSATEFASNIDGYGLSAGGFHPQMEKEGVINPRVINPLMAQLTLAVPNQVATQVGRGR